MARRVTRVLARSSVASLMLGALVIPAALPPRLVDAATATVGNGLTTTDLGSVGMTATTLAKDLAGPGVTVSNVTYSGALAQAGRIHLVDPAVVSFNDGIILSSGNVADVVGPNKSESTTGDMAAMPGTNAGAGDVDLTALIAGTQTVNPMTYDAAVLEFDFVPQASKVYFTYAFGSDEYLEWVNLFNDVFAFFVNGKNCATVPGGAVSIDSVNTAVNPTLYRDNSFASPPSQPINIEPDGLTVELICSASVTAGKANHMKLAIADTSDQILDSVVMLKQNSLSTAKPESCNDGIDNDGDGKVDMNDDSCTKTTTPPPAGHGGIGKDGNAPPFTGNEGTPIQLDASSLGWTPQGVTVSTTWIVSGINGTHGTCNVQPSGPQALDAGKIAVVWATCPKDGEYVAHVWGWPSMAGGDPNAGGSEFDYDVDFFVHNAPPSVDIQTPASPYAVRLGDAMKVRALVTDPGVADTLSCAIAWGDGVKTAGVYHSATGVCTGSHRYMKKGWFALSVSGTDNRKDTGADAITVHVTKPFRQPDGRVQLGSGAFAGNDVYNLTGLHQSRLGTAARGSTITFGISIGNDGINADSFRLKASGPASAMYSVRYFAGANDVTAAVVAGKYSTATVPRGGTTPIRVKVLVKANASLGSSVTRLVTITSRGDPTRRDAVKIIAKRG